MTMIDGTRVYGTVPVYEVRYTITIDAPELRGPTYPTVAPGTKSSWVERFTSCGRAVHRFDYLRAGNDDFSSEYVTRVAVIRRDGERTRTIRREVRRTRAQSHLTVLRRAAARAGRLMPVYRVF